MITWQNFVVCILDAQYKNNGSTQFDRFISGVNYAFTFIFALELCVNMFANLPRKFMRSGWNFLDLFVVVMSFVDYGPFDIPDWLVRLLRALRVVRLFGRVQELTKMFSSITASLFPMMNAFVILIIVLSVCECAQDFPESGQLLLPSNSHMRLMRFRPQTRSLEFRSSPTSPLTSSASSIAPSSPCSKSLQGTPGSTCCPRSPQTAISSGSLLSICAHLSSSACG